MIHKLRPLTDMMDRSIWKTDTVIILVLIPIWIKHDFILRQL